MSIEYQEPSRDALKEMCIRAYDTINGAYGTRTQAEKDILAEMQKLLFTKKQDSESSRVDEVNTPLNLISAAKDLYDACRRTVALQAKEQYLLVNFPPGTANSEDAWSEFGKEQESTKTAILNAIAKATCK
jgi:hypothetical protein